MISRFIRSAALFLALAILSGCACALAEVNIEGARAIPNERLAFRTGPGTAYGELYTLPADTPVVALELEDSGGATWVLLDFEFQGSRVRAYTGLKRVTLTGSVPYADHHPLERTLLSEALVYAAPDMYAEIRARLSADTRVLFLGFEGSFCFIEYTINGQRDRGYVREENFMVDLGEFAESFPENPGESWFAAVVRAPIYAAPDEEAELLFRVPFGGSVTLLFDEYGSVPYGWLSVYYGGLHGYARYEDFSDLRFDSPEQAREILEAMGE